MTMGYAVQEQLGGEQNSLPKQDKVDTVKKLIHSSNNSRIKLVKEIQPNNKIKAIQTQVG